MGVNVSACTCVLDHLLCLGLTLSGGSPLYALIIHWQLLLAERNSTPRFFSPPLHFLSFSSSFCPFFCSRRPSLAHCALRCSPLGCFCLGRISLELITFVILRVLIHGRALRLRQTDAGQRDVWNHSRAVSGGGGLDGIPYQAQRPAQKN